MLKNLFEALQQRHKAGPLNRGPVRLHAAIQAVHLGSPPGGMAEGFTICMESKFAYMDDKPARGIIMHIALFFTSPFESLKRVLSLLVLVDIKGSIRCVEPALSFPALLLSSSHVVRILSASLAVFSSGGKLIFCHGHVGQAVETCQSIKNTHIKLSEFPEVNLELQ